ncbi:MAG TPA: PAS domain S-box protein, partial [Spongiibacteraceae bacterium]|nr:PAS domain S-box protein [Spongiibacteraceae bacterium]
MELSAGILWGLATLTIAGWALAAYALLRRVNANANAEAVSDEGPPAPEKISMIVDDSLFEASPIGLCQLALDGRIVRANHRMQTLCGCDEYNLTAYFLPKLLHSDDVGVINVVLNELLAGNGDTREVRSRLLHANGHSVWVHLAISLVRTRGCPMHFVVAIADIGDYMLAEQIAQSEHAKFAAIAAQVPVAVWLISPDWQIIFANDEFETLTGRPRENFFANPRRYIELVHPDDVESVSRSLQNHGVGGNYEINYRMLRDDGEVRYIRQLSRGIYDVAGKLLYSVASAMDISSEMTARDELHALNSRLRETNLRLRESVRLDGLTSCLNRVALFEEAEKALLLARRYQRSSTIVFFDLN